MAFETKDIEGALVLNNLADAGSLKSANANTVALQSLGGSLVTVDASGNMASAAPAQFKVLAADGAAGTHASLALSVPAGAKALLRVAGVMLANASNSIKIDMASGTDSAVVVTPNAISFVECLHYFDNSAGVAAVAASITTVGGDLKAGATSELHIIG